MPETGENKATDQHASGLIFAFSAFLLWGLAPIYFKEVSHIPALEFLGHRMLWTFVFLIILLCFRRTLSNFFIELRQIFADRKLMILTVITAALISSNWLVYIWAIANDLVLQASLGYYINPLMNIALGMLLLGERLSRGQLMAVLLAAAGVIYLVISSGVFPLVSLYLATSFAIYALLKKKVRIGAIIGLWLEILFMLPLAIGYIVFLNYSDQAVVNDIDNYTLFLLVISGAVSTAPLLLFAMAAKRLPLSTIGLIQYMAPTITFFLAVFLWNESFTTSHMVAFGCIWTALVIYTVDSFFFRVEKNA